MLFAQSKSHISLTIKKVEKHTYNIIMAFSPEFDLSSFRMDEGIPS
jgi:hypothetical protein